MSEVFSPFCTGRLLESGRFKEMDWRNRLAADVETGTYETSEVYFVFAFR